ncbi:hypothetical protein [Agrobacterium rosae]|uniref:hypothetical protein n=1 Tax=Agrobacterium rosae TaxID=1972867 RepID=UPI003A7FD434
MSNRHGKRKPDNPAYLWSRARLSLYKVTEHSMFDEDVWRFEVLVAGKNTISANWRLGFPEEIWSSRHFQRLLHDAKRFIISYIMADKPRPSSIVMQIIYLRKLLCWMYQRDYRSFSQLDPQARKAYFDFTCGQYVDENYNYKVVATTIDGQMSIITLLFKHREMFVSLPRIQLNHGDMQAILWGGFGRKIGAQSSIPIPPVPDEIFYPLIEEALRWVDVYSADIIELVRIQEEAAAQCLSWKSNNYAEYINSRLEGYQFRLCPKTKSPWRSPLQPVEVRIQTNEDGTQRRGFRPVSTLRTLVSHLLGACAVVVQGFTGIRASELLGLTEIGEVDDELPSCVEVRNSMEGLNDVFVMNGLIFKGSRGEEPRRGSWVIGIRPAGSDFRPEVVRALLVLRKLLAGWRLLTADENAFLNPSNNRGFPRRKGSVGATRFSVLGELQQKFLEENVEVPPSVFGWRLTTHQFRKRFAQDVVRCDPDAMPALREHFKHVSMHVLESGYLGDDHELTKLVDDFALRDAAAQLMAIIEGEPVSGRMPDLFRRTTRQFEVLQLGSLSKDERQKKVFEFAESEGLRAWTTNFGTCLFRAETALCHFAKKGFYDSSSDRPLASERCADRCGGCSNLLVSRRHLSYWKQRFIANHTLKCLYKSEGNLTWGLLAARRAEVAANFLQDHGLDIEEVLNAA